MSTRTAILLFHSVILSSVYSFNTVTLSTKLGSITGISSSLYIENVTKNYAIFKKIPFAKAPVGDLRFREPIPYGPWNDTLDATSFGPSCIQPHATLERHLENKNQSEDCLHLNIYVPPGTSNLKTKSVMIWIHGGAYTFGRGMSHDMSYFSITGDVIAVSINYRLNVFGFFSTSDELSPGNYGLWDQKLAMQWVHDNIESFGGNPNSVTIFGVSAGGYSVALQAINPTNRGLFHRVIAQSGVSNGLHAVSSVPRQAASTLAQSLSCDEKLTRDTMQCMRHKSAKAIINAFTRITYGTVSSLDLHSVINFAPVVDRKFLNDTPQHILNNPNSPAFKFYKSLDVVIGNSESEGSLILGSVRKLQKHFSFKVNVSEGISSDFFCQHIVPPFVADYFSNNTAMIQVICNKYKSNGSFQEQGQNVVNYHGDVFFYNSAVNSLNVHANNNTGTKHFQYLNKRRSVYSPSSKTYPWFKEAGHAAELPYLFPSRRAMSRATQDFKSFSRTMIQYWTNFAKNGYVKLFLYICRVNKSNLK